LIFNTSKSSSNGLFLSMVRYYLARLFTRYQTSSSICCGSLRFNVNFFSVTVHPADDPSFCIDGKLTTSLMAALDEFLNYIAILNTGPESVHIKRVCFRENL